jgi:glycosyltransferase involved in cell wall biosynthesis
MPNDVLNSWKVFLDRLEVEEGHRKAMLILHTDPMDVEGPNLLASAEMLGISQNVMFSTQKVDFNDMNALYNVTDFTINISKAEGFGLATLSTMMVGKPIIAVKTGGLTRQVVDHRDGTENGVAVEPASRTMVGSQMVPYIYDDHVNYRDVAEAYWKLYKMTPEERSALGEKAKAYCDFEFDYDNMIKAWDESLDKCITEWKTNKPKQWTCEQLRSFGK